MQRLCKKDYVKNTITTTITTRLIQHWGYLFMYLLEEFFWMVDLFVYLVVSIYIYIYI
jgi:hypothetical protein